MSYTVDTTDQSATARRDSAATLFGEVQSTMAFAEPEILAIDQSTLQRWINDEPQLTVYSHYFDRLWQRQKHIRSAEVENVLSQVNDPFTSATRIHTTLGNADVRFDAACSEAGEAVPVTQSTFSTLMTSADRTLRRTAWESYTDAHLALKNTFAACLSTGVKQHVFLARIRNFNSALESALAPSFIPSEVFYNVVDASRRHMGIWHRYWRIRRQALGYSQLYAYDLRAPLTVMVPEVPFEQATDWIIEALKPLGDDYIQCLSQGVWEWRWVDKYPNYGKQAGAFLCGAPGTHPFIHMNYSNDFSGLSTLAHELGHAMHAYLTWNHQPLPYANFGLFVGEVASNFNQALVRAHLLKLDLSPEFQVAVLEEAIGTFYRYLFIMLALARFELDIHQQVEHGQGLAADKLIALMSDLLKAGYGDEVIVDQQRVGIMWAQYASHLYATFYMYQYATGLSAANALAVSVLQNKVGAVDRYLAFLKAGSSLYPLDALKLAGVDMSSPQPVEQAFGVLEFYVNRLEELMS